MTRRLRSTLALGALTLAALAVPLAARGDDGGADARPDIRVERSCTATSTVRLRVRAEDEGLLRVDVDVRTPRRGARWAVSIVHERRLAWSSTRRTSAGSGAFSVRFTTPDWPGRDAVIVRAVGPRGEICRAGVTVAGT
jgi:hypothetical protein